MTLARQPEETWQPTRLIRVAESYDTSMGTTRIKTDATFGYIKALGNRQGPHALACEFVGSSLAKWFGLTVPDFAILELPADACFDLPRSNRTQPGPAFVSRHVDGATWQGSETELRGLDNREDITRLIVFDHWVRNCDRHPPNLENRKANYANVYLAHTDQADVSHLCALDHTHCFDSGPELSPRVADIGRIQDEGVFGLFPAFRAFIDLGQLVWCESLLRGFTRGIAEEIIRQIPREWEVDNRARTALAELVHRRAGVIADRIEAGTFLARLRSTD